MFFCYKFLLCLLLINVIFNICTLEIMSPPKWMTNSRHFKYHNSRWDIWEQIMFYYLGCPRVWLCLALLHYFFYRFLSLNLSQTLGAFGFFHCIAQERTSNHAPTSCFSFVFLALSLLNLISSHSSCCLSLPSSHANIPIMELIILFLPL